MGLLSNSSCTVSWKPCPPVQSKSHSATRSATWKGVSPETVSREVAVTVTVFSSPALSVHTCTRIKSKWLLVLSSLSRNAVRMPDVKRCVCVQPAARSGARIRLRRPRTALASAPRCGPGQGRHGGSSGFAVFICKVTFLEGITLPQRNPEKIWWMCVIIHMPDRNCL